MNRIHHSWNDPGYCHSVLKVKAGDLPRLLSFSVKKIKSGGRLDVDREIWSLHLVLKVKTGGFVDDQVVPEIHGLIQPASGKY